MSYATADQANSPYAVVGQTLSTDSSPTLAQVQSWLTSHSTELDLILDSLGYTVPTSGNGYDLLVEMNRLYVGSQIGFALSAGQDVENKTGVYLKGLYSDMLEKLVSGLYRRAFDAAANQTIFYSGFPENAQITWETEW